LQWFSLVFASVSYACFKCFICFLYVSKVDRVLHMGCVSEGTRAMFGWRGPPRGRGRRRRGQADVWAVPAHAWTWEMEGETDCSRRLPSECPGASSADNYLKVE
jgi:hypothetical protein